MKWKQILYGGGGTAAMLILILDGKTALEGAGEGLRLCLGSVIPSLFPFIFLSVMLTSALNGGLPGVLRPIGKLFDLPEGSEAVLISGFLGGYPTGAQAIAQAYQSGALKKTDADRMLTFCCNAGPAFLFGMCGRLFSNPGTVWMLWGIHILSAWLVSCLFPAENISRIAPLTSRIPSVSENLFHAIRITAMICGWVMVFRVLTAFLERWFLWYLPEIWQILVMGILELTNGCDSLRQLPGEGLRLVFCSGFLAFGGLCVVMQTAAVIPGLSLHSYFRGKCLQSVFSMILSVGLSAHEYRYAALLLPLSVFLLGQRQKKSGNQRKVIV